MRLFRSEFLRARSRRLVPMVIVGGLLAVFVSLGIAAINSHPPSQAALDRAQADSEQQLQRCLSGKYLGRNREVPARLRQPASVLRRELRSLRRRCRHATARPPRDPPGGLDVRDPARSAARRIARRGRLDERHHHDPAHVGAATDQGAAHARRRRAAVRVRDHDRAPGGFCRRLLACRRDPRHHRLHTERRLERRVPDAAADLDGGDRVRGDRAVDRHDRALDRVLVGRAGRLSDPLRGGDRGVPSLDPGLAAWCAPASWS